MYTSSVGTIILLTIFISTNLQIIIVRQIIIMLGILQNSFLLFKKYRTFSVYIYSNTNTSGIGKTINHIVMAHANIKIHSWLFCRASNIVDIGSNTNFNISQLIFFNKTLHGRKVRGLGIYYKIVIVFKLISSSPAAI